jgi:hypothetical protein
LYNRVIDMGKTHLQTKVQESTAERVEAFDTDHEYGTEYEVVRQLLHSGLEAEGYGAAADGGTRRLSLVKKTLQESQRGLFFIAVAWLAATYLTPASMALQALVACGLAFVCWGLEPRIDAHAGRLGFGGGGKRA